MKEVLVSMVHLCVVASHLLGPLELFRHPVGHIGCPRIKKDEDQHTRTPSEAYLEALVHNLLVFKLVVVRRADDDRWILSELRSLQEGREPTCACAYRQGNQKMRRALSTEGHNKKRPIPRRVVVANESVRLGLFYQQRGGGGLWALTGGGRGTMMRCQGKWRLNTYEWCSLGLQSTSFLLAAPLLLPWRGCSSL